MLIGSRKVLGLHLPFGFTDISIVIGWVVMAVVPSSECLQIPAADVGTCRLVYQMQKHRLR